MTRFNVSAIIAAVALFVGLLLVGSATTVSAQKPAAKPVKKEKVVKKSDDDEDDDDGDDVSADEAKSVAITLEAARAIALAKVNGKVIDEELEKEHGRLQYAFDIKDQNGQVWDVEIHAMTGEVLQAILDDEDDDDNAVKTSKIKLKSTQTAKTVKKKP